MKILRVRFKNLNSLKGEWEIDFEQLAERGIFAITGVTGSGKSTILDAITLALYGETARHGLISQNRNEIMTKGSEECFAEVIFRSGENKIYRSRFESTKIKKRKRNRKSSDKRDKSDKHYETTVLLEELDGKGLVAGKDRVTKWRGYVKEVSRLDFDRFVHSILLAQGDFALFLKSKEKKKGEILGEITDTLIYKEIGKKVYERKREIDREFDSLKKSLSSDGFMSDDELENLKIDEKRSEESIEIKKNDLYKINKLLRYFEESRELEKLLENVQSSIKKLENELKTPKYIDRKNIIDSRNQVKFLESKLKDIDELMDEKIGLENSIKDIEESLKENSRNLESNRDRKRRLEERIERVMNVKSIEMESDNRKEELKKIKKSIGRERDSLRRLKSELEGVEKSLKSSEERVSTLGIDGLEIALSHLEYIESLESNIKNLQLKKKVKDRKLEGNLKSEDNFKSRKKFLEKRIEDFEKKSRDIEYLEKRREVLKYHKKVLEFNLIESESKTLSMSLKMLERVEKRLKREVSVEELSNLRDSLKSGEACPLCGALEHPWKGRKFDFGDAERELRNISGEIESKRDKLRELSYEKGRLKREIDGIKESVKSLEIQMGEDREIEELQRELFEIEERLKSNRKKFSHKELKNFEIEREMLKEKIQNLHRENQNIHIDLKDLETELKSYESKKSELKKKMLSFQSRYRISVDDIKNMKKNSHGSIDIDRDREIKELKDRISNLKKKKHEKNSQIYRKDREVSNLKDMAEKLEEEIETFSREKEEILRLNTNTINPLDFEGSFEEEESYLRKELESLDLIITTMNKSSIELNTELKEKRKNLYLKNKKIEKIEKSFRNLLKEFSIESEEHLKELMGISEKQFQEIKEYIDGLSSQLSRLRDSKDDLERRIDSLNRRLKGLERQKLESDKKELEDTIEASQMFIGEIKGKVKRFKEFQERNRKESHRLKRIEEEKMIFEKLYDLIGSSDGLKFSEFAQGVTMEYLLAFTNHYLQKLYPRYEIIQAKDSNLNLEVLDRKRGNTKRDINTLSGGESFLVSLALALGLSDLAGNDIRIETLFLDEGFGTLDSETLENVLSILETLRAENRMIGIISHIDIVKERIPNQIEVKIDSNGVGRLNSRFRIASDNK